VITAQRFSPIFDIKCEWCDKSLMMISPEQVRAARALLRLDQDDLARRATVSVATVRRLEAADGLDRVVPATLDKLRRVLEAEGAEFIEGGVRRRRVPAADPTLFRDLEAISIESARQLAGYTLLTDADLYDEDGLPA